MPASLLLSQMPFGPAVFMPAPQSSGSLGDLVVPISPLSLSDNEGIEGDDPVVQSDALPVPVLIESRSEVLAPPAVPATIAGEVANLRNGPGTEYDQVGQFARGTPIEVIGRYNDWYQVREAVGKPVLWVGGDLLGLTEEARAMVYDVDPATIPLPPPPKVGTTVEAGVTLRDGPGTNYVGMARLNQWQDLTLLARYRNWYQVIYGDQIGWVSGQFLAIPPEIVQRVHVASTIPDPNPQLVGIVRENLTNLRKGPNSAYGKVGMVDAGTLIDLIGRNQGWYQVKLSDGSKAWIWGELLDVDPMVQRRLPVSNDFTPLPRAQPRSGGGGSAAINIPVSGDVASYAVQLRGSAYRYGAAGPSAFDCSGFTSYVYRQYGVALPRTAASQYSTSIGAQVGLDGLKAGDLVFFTRTDGRRGITHVALYLGDGHMIHAMNKAYGVAVSNLYDDYWISRFVGGIRPYR